MHVVEGSSGRVREQQTSSRPVIVDDWAEAATVWRPVDNRRGYQLRRVTEDLGAWDRLDLIEVPGGTRQPIRWPSLIVTDVDKAAGQPRLAFAAHYRVGNGPAGNLPVCERLARNHQVFAPTHPGFGRSSGELRAS